MSDLRSVFELFKELEDYDFRNPVSCQICPYYADCEMYWTFCPYDGRNAMLKRADVEILEEGVESHA